MQGAGYSVALAGRRTSKLEETAAMGDAHGEKMLARRNRCQAVRFGRAPVFENARGVLLSDVLFNNVGVTAPPIPIEALTFAQWSEVVKVHLTGAFLSAQEAVRMMKA